MQRLRRAPGTDDLLVMKAMFNHLQGRYDEETRIYRPFWRVNPGILWC